MTVGISITNGMVAYLIADSRETGWRQIDSANKFGSFTHPNFYGQIFGTGAANPIEGVLKTQKATITALPKKGTLDDFVTCIQQDMTARFDQMYQRIRAAGIKSINERADLVPEKDRVAFVEMETRKFQQEYERMKRSDELAMLLVTHDKKEGKIRQHILTQETATPYFLDHLELGSGKDGANFYFAQKLQGINVPNLAPADLAFFALNAYAFATLNQGVGGTPKMAVISSQKNKVIPVERVLALTNVSGVYLSEDPNHTLTNLQAREITGEILTAKDPDYQRIAKAIGMDAANLTSTYTPFSSLQERANRSLYRGNGKKS